MQSIDELLRAGREQLNSYVANRVLGTMLLADCRAARLRLSVQRSLRSEMEAASRGAMPSDGALAR